MDDSNRPRTGQVSDKRVSGTAADIARGLEIAKKFGLEFLPPSEV